jgi:serine protease Do
MPHSSTACTTTALTVLALLWAAPVPAVAQQTPTDFTEIVAQMTPAVVAVTSRRQIEQQAIPDALPEPFAERFRRQMPAPPQEAEAMGSGFLISEDGYIVTNNHVIQEASEIQVLLSDGTSRAAELVGSDSATDIAVLQIDSTQGMAVARWGDSDAVQPGAWTIAIGSPFGLGGTVTVGVLSARSRDIRSGPYDDYLQTDASVNRGNSGGPLFDARGQVIGVNTAIISPTGGNIGIGFAVPSRAAQRVVEQLIETGEVQRGYIGVRLQDMTDALARALDLQQAEGTLVAQVEPDSPAEAAGLRSGDVILEIEGQEVESSRELSFAVAERAPGDEVALTVRRDGEARAVRMALGSRETPQETSATAEPPDTADESRLGLALAPLPDMLRNQMGIEEQGGVVVQRVHPGSLAAESGLHEGDIILEAANRPLEEPRDLADAWASAQQQDRPMLLRVRREDNAIFVAVES